MPRLPKRIFQKPEKFRQSSMRPVLLQPLFASLSGLSGIGEKTLARLAKLLKPGSALPAAESPLSAPLPRLIDLLHFPPNGLVDRRGCYPIAALPPQKIATLSVTIRRHIAPRLSAGNRPYKIIAADKTGEMELVFFRPQPDWLQKLFPIGEQRLISGKIEYFNGVASMVHPDYSLKPEEKALLPLLEPVYPLTAGLSGRTVAHALRQALQRLPDMPEWLDEKLLKQEKFPSYPESLRRLHQPQEPDDILPEGAPRRRLAYDELLAGQLALALRRRQNRRGQGAALPPKNSYAQKLRQLLPFSLTNGQEQSLAEIKQDLAGSQRMLRLLQGDVGSGKTAVALLAMAQAAESGAQAALMAPTEILARQHYAALSPLAEQAGLRAALLTGREKGSKRAAILQQIASGMAQFIIGTHALFQSDVRYHRLGLAVIDEQHRFGVEQRLRLAAKGKGVNILVMTATPIPRSLVLTAYGDMDISAIKEKPPGRKPIKTALLSMAKMDALLAAVRRALARGEKIYWICPLVEESEKSDLTAAEERFAQLRQYFGAQTGLIHGKMAAAAKDEAMAAFKAGAIRLLVATIVVEVGVDVGDAAIIIIEHAERFGLAQLHQMRGRVGRGEKPSSCTLLYKEPLSSTALARLSILRETEDGFRLAEEDLRLRGEGDILGLRQSGRPDFCFADSHLHSGLLVMAAKHARLLAEDKTIWTGARGEALRLLLALFRQDNALRLPESG